MKSDHIERTLVLIKPDGLKRGLVGRILSRFEDAGLKIVAIKMERPDEEFAKKHYTEDISIRRGEKVRQIMVAFICANPVVALALEGVGAIEIVRKIVGETEPRKALPGTIRGDFQHVSFDYANDPEVDIVVKNIIHASADKNDAKNELDLWFSDKELFEYRTVHEAEVLE